MSKMMQRSSRKFNDCGLSTSLYSTCYPESLAERAASNASMSGGDVFHHHSEYGGGRLMPQEESVRFYIGETADDDDLDVAIDAAATLAAGTAADVGSSSPRGSGSDTLSLYEEECHSGLLRLLSVQVGPAIEKIFCDHFGVTMLVHGLGEILDTIMEDLLHLSEVEPYGVRGANLIVHLGKPVPRSTVRKSSVNSANSSASVCSSGYDDASGGQQVANITDVTVLGSAKLCAETVTTFDLILTLKESRTLRDAIKNWMAANVFKSKTKQCVVLEPQFTLRKKKLYR